MDNINKKVIYGVAICISVLLVGYILYSYTQQKIEKKISKEKRKLKKYYEQQFNKMFYQQNEQDEHNENVNYIDPIEQRINDHSESNNESAPSGIESDGLSSHFDTMENGQVRDIKILGNDYKRSDTGKKCRG